MSAIILSCWRRYVEILKVLLKDALAAELGRVLRALYNCLVASTTAIHIKALGLQNEARAHAYLKLMHWRCWLRLHGVVHCGQLKWRAVPLVHGLRQTIGSKTRRVRSLLDLSALVLGRVRRHYLRDVTSHRTVVVALFDAKVASPVVFRLELALR